MLSLPSWLTLAALIIIGLLAAMPGLIAFRRQLHNDALPAQAMEREIAALKKEIATLKQDRLELSAKIVDSQNEVERMRSQLKQFSTMKATVDRLLLENTELRQQIDALLKGKPVPAPITTAGQQTKTGRLGPLMERERVVTGALDVVETQIAAQGGEFTAPFQLMVQRDGLKKTLREIEDEIERLHLEDK